jgi:hypothetical protein
MRFFRDCTEYIIRGNPVNLKKSVPYFLSKTSLLHLKQKITYGPEFKG